MPRTCLENLEKRRWASEYWRELPAAIELRDLLQHELVRKVERRCYRRELDAGDQEQIARSLTGLRHLLILREREQQRFRLAYPGLHRLRAAA